MNPTIEIQSRSRGNKPLVKTPATPPSAGTSLFDGLVDEIRHADFGKLVDAVELLKRSPRAATGFPTIRPADCRAVTDALSVYLQRQRHRFLQADSELPPRFFALLDELAKSDIRAYPNELAHVDLLRAEALLLSGQHEAALALVSAKAERPYLVEDNFNLLERVLVVDTLAHLSAGRHEDVQRTGLGRALLLARLKRTPPHKIFTNFVSALATSPLRPLRYSAMESVALLSARASLRLRLRDHRRGLQRFAVRALTHMLSLLGGAALQLVAFRERPLHVQASVPSRPATVTKSREILVTRGMGGIGDILMMTPGLHALAQKTGRRVHFSTKRQFFPLLEGNPDLELVDIDQTIDVAQYRRWINLSICPAGRYEGRNAPRVRKGRVELFARALGITKKDLDRHGWRPVHSMTPEQRLQRDAYRADFRQGGLPVIGVQPYSRDTYKNAPALFAALPRMAEHAHIVLFHSSPIQIAPHRNIVQFEGTSLRQTLAGLAACDYFVAVDSGFFHFMAALEIPSLGIFGPTDGEVVSRHHAQAMALMPPPEFGCVPCWRGEDRACQVTGGRTSACMAAIGADSIVSQVQALQERYPLAPAAQGPSRLGIEAP
jgi:ADP-heptose:LPS heptosyltransferase